MLDSQGRTVTEKEQLAYYHAAEIANLLLTDGTTTTEAMLLKNDSRTEALLLVSNDPAAIAVIRRVLSLMLDKEPLYTFGQSHRKQ